MDDMTTDLEGFAKRWGLMLSIFGGMIGWAAWSLKRLGLRLVSNNLNVLTDSQLEIRDTLSAMSTDLAVYGQTLHDLRERVQKIEERQAEFSRRLESGGL